MGLLLLNSNSVIMCPHGGIVQHVPTLVTSYRIAGCLPLAMSEVYLVAGCPFYTDSPSPCATVQWVTASQLIFVKGQPLLTMGSVGLCMAGYGVAQGPAIIAAVNAGVQEPETQTFIND